MNTKKKYFLLFFVFIAYQTLLPQWSTDPNNNLIVGYGLDPKICSDSAGGCYITYNYGTLSYPQKLALERLDKYGYKPWGTLKQILGELPEQWQAEIIEDGEGGVIVSYQDNEWIPPAYFNSKVRVQKVDSSGNFLWGLTGVRVTIEETNHGQEPLVSDGEGGCVIVWQDYDGEYSINRINKWGERVWGDSGRILGTSAYTGWSIIRAADGNYYVETGEYIYRIRQNGDIVRRDSITLGYIVADPEGGIVLSGITGNINNRILVAQRKDSLGNNLWQEPYVEIADSLYYLNPRLSIKQNSDYFYYAWTGKRNGIDKVAQFQVLRLNGSKLFPDGSIQVGVPPLNGTIVQPLEEYRTSFVYYSSDFLPDTLLAQAYDTLGNKLWIENGVVIAHPPIEYQSYTTDGSGGFIIGGVINNFTVVAQQISRNGNLGEVLPVPVELVSFTGTVNDKKITLNWITSTELNNYGFEIERLKDYKIEKSNEWEKIGFVEGHGTTTETQSYSFIDRDVLTGKVKYRLKQIDFDGSYEYSNEIEVNTDIAPKEFVLHQNYPNPFNSSTIIKYQIPEEGRVTINLYNILGEKVKTLFQGDQIKGTYTLVVQSDELPSGHYFYSLESSSTRIIKKFTILK